MFRAVKTCTKNLWKMSSLAETMKQLRALNGLVEKLRAETRSFLEAKDREFKKQFYADTDALIQSTKAGAQHQYQDRRSSTSVTTGESKKREVSVYGQTH